MDQPPTLRTSVSLATHPLPPPPEPAVQSAVNPLDAQLQQVDDLESEMSALQKKLMQQIEKYDHDMDHSGMTIFSRGSSFVNMLLHPQHSPQPSTSASCVQFILHSSRVYAL